MRSLMRKPCLLGDTEGLTERSIGDGDDTETKDTAGKGGELGGVIVRSYPAQLLAELVATLKGVTLVKSIVGARLQCLTGTTVIKFVSLAEVGGEGVCLESLTQTASASLEHTLSLEWREGDSSDRFTVRLVGMSSCSSFLIGFEVTSCSMFGEGKALWVDSDEDFSETLIFSLCSLTDPLSELRFLEAVLSND